MSLPERQALNVIAPKQSNTPGEGVTFLAATTTAANTAVPEKLFDRYVYLGAEGDTIWVSFGPNASPAIDKSKAGGATFDAGTSDQNAITIPAGGRIPVRLRKGQHDYIKWQANAANSRLTIYPTTPAKTWG
ncbi:MAG TPA: hypothetical protein VFN70_18150 [Burkholderiales bacterium]|nr:hypothetical protein [Burkholderiales bacterium]